MKLENKVTERFREKTTTYLDELAKNSQAVRDMYFFNPKYENIPADLERDILLEKKYTAVKGLVHKFEKRVLLLLSYSCVANCRFCERQDRVGVGLDKLGHLRTSDIDTIIDYLKEHKEIEEVIFSGGDPLTNPMGLLYACEKLKDIEHIKIIRIHTKMPLQNPSKVDIEVLKKVITTKATFYFSVHVNHPDELTPIALDLLYEIRKKGFIMIAQSVFLKGINDSIELLETLFTVLSHNGIRPYYIYHCQNIPTTTRFIMDLKDEIAIMSELRNRLSGIAYPNHVIDLQNTIGKVLVPTNHWNTNYSSVKSFTGEFIELTNYDY